jgi:endonuclease/exonuclease/phosphatase family metal-dependent hydrolase
VRRLQRSFRWANVVLIFLTFFAYLSPYIHPDTLWLFAVLGLFYPVLLVLNIAFIIYWLILKRRYALLSFACLLLGGNHFTSFVGLSLVGGSDGGETALKVMSYNIYGFFNQGEGGRSARAHWTEADLVDFYQQYHPDVWCFQEFSTVPKYVDQYADLIKTKTPLKNAYFEPQTGLAVFSRYPIKGVKIHYYGQHNSINGYLIADIQKGDQTIRLFNIHLQTNAVSQMANEVAQNGQLREKETWLQIKGMIGRYRRSAAMRSDQAREIRALLEDSPHPVILCGDFNDVPLSYAYHQISDELADGFQRKGKGLGTTFHGSLPALRIDYILSSPEFRTLDYRVIKKGFSDHYPVMST